MAEINAYHTMKDAAEYTFCRTKNSEKDQIHHSWDLSLK